MVVSDCVANQPHLPHVLLVSKPQCAVHLPASCAAADLAHNTALVVDLQPQGACVSHRWATHHWCFCNCCLCVTLNLPLRLIRVCVLCAGVPVQGPPPKLRPSRWQMLWQAPRTAPGLLRIHVPGVPPVPPPPEPLLPAPALVSGVCVRCWGWGWSGQVCLMGRGWSGQVSGMCSGGGRVQRRRK